MFTLITHVDVDLNRALAGKPLVAFLQELENWQLECAEQAKITGNGSEHAFADHVSHEIAQVMLAQRGAQNTVLTKRMLEHAIDSYKGPGAFDLSSGVLDFSEMGPEMDPAAKREWDDRVHVLRGSMAINGLYTAAQVSAQNKYHAYAQAVRDKMAGPIPSHMRMNLEAAAFITKAGIYAGRKNTSLFDAFWQLEIERHYVDLLSLYRGSHKGLSGKALQVGFWRYIDMIAQDLKLPSEPAKQYDPQHFRSELTYERGKLMALRAGAVPTIDDAMRLRMN